MPRKATTMVLSLTEEAHSSLAALARSRTAPAHHVERSAIILYLADRRDASEIAAILGIDRQRVTRCARRVTAVGPLKAIDDLPRSGRPADINEAVRLWLIGEACAQPKGRGYPHELWTLRLLAAHARSHGCGMGHVCLAELAASTVHDILNGQPVKPHKVRYYLERRDPAFDEHKAEVLEVYAAAEMLRALPEAERPVAVAVVSYDEKPGVQAIATTAPDLPPRPASTPPSSATTNTNGLAQSRFPRPSTSSSALSTMPSPSVTVRASSQPSFSNSMPLIRWVC